MNLESLGFGGGFTGGYDLPSMQNMTAGIMADAPNIQEPGFWAKTKGWMSNKDNIDMLSGAMQSLARIIDPESPQVKAGDTIFGQKNLAALLSTLKQGTEYSERDKDGGVKTLKANPIQAKGGKGGSELGSMGKISDVFDSEMYKGILAGFGRR